MSLSYSKPSCLPIALGMKSRFHSLALQALRDPVWSLPICVTSTRTTLPRSSLGLQYLSPVDWFCCLWFLLGTLCNWFLTKLAACFSWASVPWGPFSACPCLEKPPTPAHSSAPSPRASLRYPVVLTVPFIGTWTPPAKGHYLSCSPAYLLIPSHVPDTEALCQINA